MAQEAATGAYTELAAAVCATNFAASADTGTQRDELLALASHKQRTFVQEQQWALMPDEMKVTRPVAELCARKIAEMDPGSDLIHKLGHKNPAIPVVQDGRTVGTVTANSIVARLKSD